MIFVKILLYDTQMKILHLACLNNDPEIQPNVGLKCNPVGGEPRNALAYGLVGGS